MAVYPYWAFPVSCGNNFRAQSSLVTSYTLMSRLRHIMLYLCPIVLLIMLSCFPDYAHNHTRRPKDFYKATNTFSAGWTESWLRLLHSPPRISLAYHQIDWESSFSWRGADGFRVAVSSTWRATLPLGRQVGMNLPFTAQFRRKRGPESVQLRHNTGKRLRQAIHLCWRAVRIA